MKNFSVFNKKVLLCAISLNLLFIISSGYIVYRPNIAKRINRIFFKTHSKNNEAFKPNYYIQKSYYEALPDTNNEIVFLGDSITDFGRWNEMFNNVNIKNRGIRGDRTDGVLGRLNEIVSSSPDKIFLMIGINDLSSKKKLSEIVSNYEQILRYIIEKTPQTKIYVQSVLPVNENIPNRLGHAKTEDVIKLNSELKVLCLRYGIKYIDLFHLFGNDSDQLKREYTIDGLHPNGKGYLMWKSAIEKYVSN
jgi:lysophospholipase L1-like esterase